MAIPPIIDAQGLNSLKKLLGLHDVKLSRTKDETRPHPLAQAPEVYLAKAQTSIPALLPAGYAAGTGSGSGSGSGTLAEDVSGSDFDEPGVATCDLYVILIDDTSGDPELHDMALDQKVYNITSSAITTDDWLLVIRDKWGRWIASPIRSEPEGEEITVVTDVRVNGLTIQKKTRLVKVIPLAAESDWTTIHTGVTCETPGTGTGTGTGTAP